MKAAVMLTISRLGHRSIKYYNDTADQAKCTATKDRTVVDWAEYYSEGETRIPNWLVVGDRAAIARSTGLGASALEGGDADTEIARAWLDAGVAPNGVNGREFTDKSVHGFDLTFSAPNSVSLIRALTDDIAEKVLATAHPRGARRHAVSARSRGLHPRAQPDHRKQRPPVSAGIGGHRLPARNIPVR